jgi:molybdopterin/thiamine biosynthesis adenylyltransferase
MHNADEIVDRIPQWDSGKVRNARVLVVGAGALGNEVLKNLALLGVRRLVIMDFDRVEASNLSRSVLFRGEDAAAGRFKADVAAERLLEINPELELLVLKGDVVTDLSWGLLRQVDVVIGCVDNRLARLYLNRWCWRAGRPWVDGGILQLSGQVSAYVPGVSCYECGLTALGWKEIRQRLGCTDMARRYALDGSAPTTPIAASVIGAWQVQEALKLVMGMEGQALVGRFLSVEGAFNAVAVYEQKALREVCGSHFTVVDDVVMAPLGVESTVGELWDYLSRELGMRAPSLGLDHSVALRIAALVSGRGEDVVLPVPRFSDALAEGFALRLGEAVGVPKGAMVEEVVPGMGLEDVALWRLGVPAGHVLRVGRGEERRWVGLGWDIGGAGFGFASANSCQGTPPGRGVREVVNRWWGMVDEAVLRRV